MVAIPELDPADKPWARTFKAHVGPGSIRFAWMSSTLWLSVLDIAGIIGRKRDVRRLLRKAFPDDVATYQTTSSPHPLVFVTDLGAMRLLHRVRHPNKPKVELWVVRQSEMLASIFRNFEETIRAGALLAIKEALPEAHEAMRRCDVLESIVDPARFSVN